MANTFYVENFKSPKNLAYVVYALVVVQVVAYAIVVITSLAYLIDPAWYFGLKGGIAGRLILVCAGVSPTIRLIAYSFAAIFFFLWIYRAYSNLSPLKARNLEFSPGWAVGWWFIPFANLVKSYQVVRELWTSSDPDFNEDLNFMPMGPSGNSALGFWWGTYLIGNLALRISDALSKDQANLKAAVLLGLIGSAVHIFSATLFIIIVNDITGRQLQRAARLEETGFRNAEPPPPPMFEPEMA